MKKLIGLLLQLLGISFLFVASAPISIWFILLAILLGGLLIWKGGKLIDKYNKDREKEDLEIESLFKDLVNKI